MKNIHSKELFNFVSFFSRKETNLLSTALSMLGGPRLADILRKDKVAQIKNMAHNYFGVDRQSFVGASDDQVYDALKWVESSRNDSRRDAQLGMMVVFTGCAVSFASVTPAIALVTGLYGVFKLNSARMLESKAVDEMNSGLKQIKDVATAPAP